jgi:salicylate hydroxylase
VFETRMAAFLAGLKDWTPYPIHTVSLKAPWSDGRRALLIGDAAHAMAPYGAQGAAMAIEDAWVMAACLAKNRDDAPAAITAYEALRRPRIRRVAARTASNRFAYHAGGPVAWARDALFRARGQKMLDGLDWIYGWE